MPHYTRNAWAIIGYTWKGAAYCLECAARGLMETDMKHEQDTDQPAPIFASDEFSTIDPTTGEHTPHPCDTCHAEI